MNENSTAGTEVAFNRKQNKEIKLFCVFLIICILCFILFTIRDKNNTISDKDKIIAGLREENKILSIKACPIFSNLNIDKTAGGGDAVA